MINAIQPNWARSYEWTIVALEMGVQRKANVVCSKERLRARGGFGITHSVYEIIKRKRMWTAIRKGSGLPVVQRAVLSR